MHCHYARPSPTRCAHALAVPILVLFFALPLLPLITHLPARLPPSPRLQGCCTENARKNGGLLIDLEINTARRFWGDKKVRGLAGIQFQILDD